LRKEVSSFSIDAITDCEDTHHNAKELNTEQLRISLQGGYGIFGGTPKNWAKLKFTPARARWVKREEWHPEQKSHEEEDGSFVLEIPYSDERELIGDILRYGHEVEVTWPPELRKLVKDQLLQALSSYS
jgi:predicted DNA-binding transcriptional regulator YafY